MTTKTIAEIEAQCVVLREALDELVKHTNQCDKFSHPVQPLKKHDCQLCRANRLLSKTTDYSNKVVVDKEEWRLMNEVEDVARTFFRKSRSCADISASECGEMIADAIHARLDSIRKGGEQG